MPGVSRFPRARTDGFTFAVAAGLAVLPVLTLRPVGDPSPWLHLRVGEYLLAGSRFSLPDPWSPLASVAYVPTQWLPSMLSAGLYEHFGTPVIAWERATGIAVVALGLMLWVRSLARPWIALLVTAMALVAAWPSLTERPQLAGFALLIPTLAGWWRTGEDLKVRWWLVPLTWVAACTHGVWVMGVALGAVTVMGLLADRRLRRAQLGSMLAVLAACAVAAALTPVGPRLLLTPFSVSSNGRQFVQEWLPSSVRSPSVLVALGMLGLVWILWIHTERRPRLLEVALLCVAFCLILYMQRTVAIGAFVAAPLLGNALERGLPRNWISPQRRLGRFADPKVLWSASAAVGIALSALVSVAADMPATGVPTTLTSSLRKLPADTRVVAEGDLTGWLLFEAPNVHPVFDIRIESYSAGHVRRFIAAMHAERGWERFVSDSGATTALLPRDSALLAALTEQLGWTEVAADDEYVLVRASA